MAEESEVVEAVVVELEIVDAAAGLVVVRRVEGHVHHEAHLVQHPVPPLLYTLASDAGNADRS